ncbi:hypothetical protein [Parvimonas micra]
MKQQGFREPTRCKASWKGGVLICEKIFMSKFFAKKCPQHVISTVVKCSQSSPNFVYL